MGRGIGRFRDKRDARIRRARALNDRLARPLRLLRARGGTASLRTARPKGNQQNRARRPSSNGSKRVQSPAEHSHPAMGPGLLGTVKRSRGKRRSMF